MGEAPKGTAIILQNIIDERLRQLDKHGDQSHLPNGTGPNIMLDDLPLLTPSAKHVWTGDLAPWAKARCQAASQNEGGNGTITYEHILTEEWAEAISSENPDELRSELIQVATVCLAWIEKIDKEKRNTNG
jgi:hypothetical protein